MGGGKGAEPDWLTKENQIGSLFTRLAHNIGNALNLCVFYFCGAGYQVGSQLHQIGSQLNQNSSQ